MEGSKIYLRPGDIRIAKNGIFILVEGQLKTINHLEMDDQGVYFDAYRQAGYVDYCPVCNFPLIWGFCFNSQCPSKR